MVTNMVPAREVAEQIKPGRIYLTKGNVQQIKCLLPPGIKAETHYNPTTTVFRQWLIPNPMDDEPRAKIIYYPKLEGTGRVKETKTRGEAHYGSVKSKNPYALPTDQTLQLPKHIYFFVVLCDPITGEINAVNAKSNLQGDYLVELDLRYVLFNEESDLYNELPLTAQARAGVTDPLVLKFYEDDLKNPEEVSYFHEANYLISKLLDSSGARHWYNLGQQGEYYKWFLVKIGLYRQPEKKKMPIILNSGRAWSLFPYLELFLDQIQDNGQTAPLQLSKFATWVYLATTVYAVPGANGLYWYTQQAPRRGYWRFYPSAVAKLTLPYFLNER